MQSYSKTNAFRNCLYMNDAVVKSPVTVPLRAKRKILYKQPH